MLNLGKSYNEVREEFRWHIPEFYNIGVDVCDRWVGDPHRLALIYEDEKGQVQTFTFSYLKKLSNQLANGLRAHGVERGDRVAILLGQCPETAVSHIAVYKLGGIAVPLFALFGPEALQYRLSNSGAKAIITDEPGARKIFEIRDELPALQLVITTNAQKLDSVIDYQDLLDKGSTEFEPVNTRADDAALIIYTSGTTGPPKGALHAHRVLLGHLPGVELPHNFFPQEGDRFWTPADWAWIGGLYDVLFPSLHHGVTVVAHRAKKFDPEEAFRLISRHGIQNSFMPPTALKLMRQVKDAGTRYNIKMRSVACGGETLGTELLDWGREALGTTINEFYGQTEVNVVVGNSYEIMEVRPGSMGRPMPGHAVEVVDGGGSIVKAGVVGEVAIRRPDPVMFLEYWQNPNATTDKYVGDWCLTGDLARKDEDGYLWYVGRTDDVITSAGYRIGPAEIEDCILKHPSVSMVAVIGSPDPVRTEIVKAFIVLKTGMSPGPALGEEIKNFVKVRLAAHEFPREVEFVADLPMTATGKIMRKELRKLELLKKQGKQQHIVSKLSKW